MAAAFLRLLTLLALMLMPAGMAGAAASAQPVDHAAVTQSDHCSDQPEEDGAPASKPMDCTAACTALPASFAPRLAPPLKPDAPRTIATATPFTGVLLEIATPPPRRS
jgi:hypothetical protein